MATFYVIQELYRAGMTPAVMASEVLAIDRQIPIYFGPDDVVH